MIVDDRDIARLRAAGVRVLNGDGKPLAAAKKQELDYLRDIAASLARFLERPSPTVEPPVVNVAAPILPPPSKPVRKWRFTLTKNNQGQTTEIIATALE